MQMTNNEHRIIVVCNLYFTLFFIDRKLIRSRIRKLYNSLRVKPENIKQQYLSEGRIIVMKSLLLSVIILSVIGCALTKPSSTSTVQTKSQITYKWSQMTNYFTKKEVESILGVPSDILYSEEAEIWKYEYDIARSFGTVSFRRSDNRVWFLSKPSF